MATGKKKSRPAQNTGGPSGSTPATPAGAKPAAAKASPGKPAPAKKPAQTPGGSVRRESVASVRKTGNNRTQLIIGVVAVALIAVVVIAGLVLNKANDTRRNDGYGTATKSVATVADGVITVSVGTPAKMIDVYEDPLCPNCGDFEYQFGQEIAQGVDEGKVGVNYHFMNFLDSQSASGNYSTRAVAALQCVAQTSGSAPGVFAKFHDSLFARDQQPEEGGDSDHSDAELAARATAAGATAAAACITDGTNAALAATTATNSSATLQAAGGTGTPTVVYNGALILNDENWFANLVAAP